MINNNRTTAYSYLGVGSNYNSSIQEVSDISLYTPTGGAMTTTIKLSTDQIRLDAIDTFANNIVVTGRIEMESGLIYVVKFQLVLQQIEI